jgi:hypothetical protein
MDSEILATRKLTDAVTLATPTPRLSNGSRFEQNQGELGEEVPEAFQSRAENNPFAAWIADSMAYGAGPTLVATSADRVFFLSRLSANKQGFLIGEKRANGKTRWLEYKHVDEMSFEQARDIVIQWTAKSQPLFAEDAA